MKRRLSPLPSCGVVPPLAEFAFEKALPKRDARWATVDGWHRAGLVKFRWDDSHCFVQLTEKGRENAGLPALEGSSSRV